MYFLKTCLVILKTIFIFCDNYIAITYFTQVYRKHGNYSILFFKYNLKVSASGGMYKLPEIGFFTKKHEAFPIKKTIMYLRSLRFFGKQPSSVPKSTLQATPKSRKQNFQTLGYLLSTNFELPSYWFLLLFLQIFITKKMR